MPNPLNETNIIAPRVPIIDERSGLISREWYRFFLNLFVLTGSGRNDTSLLDLQVGPPVQPYIDIHAIDPTPIGFDAYSAGSTQESQIAELQKQIEALQVQPIADVGAISASIAALSNAPVIKTTDFTVAANETWIINNKSGSTCIVTLPSASLYVGRYLTFKNMQSQLLNSASSNVVPIDSTTAGTAILLNVIGNWATMVSDGTNWIIMQSAANNNLLLE